MKAGAFAAPQRRSIKPGERVTKSSTVIAKEDRQKFLDTLASSPPSRAARSRSVGAPASRDGGDGDSNDGASRLATLGLKRATLHKPDTTATSPDGPSSVTLPSLPPRAKSAAGSDLPTRPRPPPLGEEDSSLFGRSSFPPVSKEVAETAPEPTASLASSIFGSFWAKTSQVLGGSAVSTEETQEAKRQAPTAASDITPFILGGQNQKGSQEEASEGSPTVDPAKEDTAETPKDVTPASKERDGPASHSPATASGTALGRSQSDPVRPHVEPISWHRPPPVHPRDIVLAHSSASKRTQGSPRTPFDWLEQGDFRPLDYFLFHRHPGRAATRLGRAPRPAPVHASTDPGRLVPIHPPPPPPPPASAFTPPIPFPPYHGAPEAKRHSLQSLPNSHPPQFPQLSTPQPLPPFHQQENAHTSAQSLSSIPLPPHHHAPAPPVLPPSAPHSAAPNSFPPRPLFPPHQPAALPAFAHPAQQQSVRQLPGQQLPIQHQPIQQTYHPGAPPSALITTHPSMASDPAHAPAQVHQQTSPTSPEQRTAASQITSPGASIALPANSGVSTGVAYTTHPVFNAPPVPSPFASNPGLPDFSPHSLPPPPTSAQQTLPVSSVPPTWPSQHQPTPLIGSVPNTGSAPPPLSFPAPSVHSNVTASSNIQTPFEALSPEQSGLQYGTVSDAMQTPASAASGELLAYSRPPQETAPAFLPPSLSRESAPSTTFSDLPPPQQYRMPEAPSSVPSMPLAVSPLTHLPASASSVYIGTVAASMGAVFAAAEHAQVPSPLSSTISPTSVPLPEGLVVTPAIVSSPTPAPTFAAAYHSPPVAELTQFLGQEPAVGRGIERKESLSLAIPSSSDSQASVLVTPPTPQTLAPPSILASLVQKIPIDESEATSEPVEEYEEEVAAPPQLSLDWKLPDLGFAAESGTVDEERSSDFFSSLGGFSGLGSLEPQDDGQLPFPVRSASPSFQLTVDEVREEEDYEEVSDLSEAFDATTSWVSNFKKADLQIAAEDSQHRSRMNKWLSEQGVIPVPARQFSALPLGNEEETAPPEHTSDFLHPSIYRPRTAPPSSVSPPASIGQTTAPSSPWLESTPSHDSVSIEKKPSLRSIRNRAAHLRSVSLPQEELQVDENAPPSPTTADFDPLPVVTRPRAVSSVERSVVFGGSLLSISEEKEQAAASSAKTPPPPPTVQLSEEKKAVQTLGVAPRLSLRISPQRSAEVKARAASALSNSAFARTDSSGKGIGKEEETADTKAEDAPKSELDDLFSSW